jgi:Outer membrane protein and related peptidoglycan-associated (lipo)proteins
MAGNRPILGDIELQNVQKIDIEEDQVFTQHSVPALEGDFLQGLGRSSNRVTLNGVLTGPVAGEGLKTLREKFRAAEPVPFVADITTATQVGQVFIEEMEVRELAGKPERFEYGFTLIEFISPPGFITEEPPEPDVPESPVDDIEKEVGTLIVEVIVEGQSDFDFSLITVTVQGAENLSRTLTNRQGNIWTAEDIPASQGEYTVQAVETNPQALSGSATVVVRAGQTTQVSVTLNPTSNIANMFIVHFRFDKAFIEPCMRPVLQQAAQYADTHRDEKLLIVGHTDKAGSSGYNQSLSERRARSVFDFLTVGVDDNARRDALTDWEALRQTRQGGGPSVQDNWDIREYQHILQQLNFYPGRVDGQRGPLTRDAVQAYRCHKGLPPGTDVDDDVWQALIEDYLTEEPLAVPTSRFFPNCDGEILKWLGCGEDDPLDRRGTAFRPSRRVEILFVRVNGLPCEVPQPVTFNLAPGATVNANWCLDSGAATSRCCFVSPFLQPNGQPQPCPSDPNGPWCRHYAEPGQITVVVSIQRELPDGTLEPVPNQKFVLISPKGEFKAGEQSNGEPTPGRTSGSSDPNPGTFTFPNMPVGFYSLEVITPVSSPVLVWFLDETDAAVRGNAVCKQLRPDPSNPTAPVRLDVVIVNAPVMREIRLPVAVHLMKPLNSDGTIRTCTSVTGASVQQHTTHTDDEIRSFFDGANKIWRQARIRFEPVAIVREAYVHPIDNPVLRGNCEVDNNELTFILDRCAYPDVVNVFFFGDFAGTSEAGKSVSVENARLAGVEPGCAVADRFQFTILGIPRDRPLSTQQGIQVLAHELGHYLNLDHTDPDPANEDRLMFPNTTLTGDNTTLIPAEVSSVRASEGATDDCVPLTLKVDGASRIGGSMSHQFIFVQHPELIDPFDITIDAEIPDNLLTRGTLIMTGGNPGANSLQRTVSKSTTGEFEIVATYTSASGGQPVTTRVVIRVSTFRRLRVEGGRVSQVGGTESTTFVVIRDPDPVTVITVVAEIDPILFCVPTSLVIWTGGDSAPNPLRRTVPQHQIGPTTVTATLPGTGNTRSVTIFVARLTLDVDADRDGIVEDEAEGRDRWEFGSGRKGAVILVNNDDDNSTSALDLENAAVDGVTDVDDLAPLVIRRTGPVPTGVSLVLSVTEQSKIRIFNTRSSSGTAIVGPSPLPSEIVVSGTDAADLELGMEGIQYPSGGFNGLIDLKLSLKEGVTELAIDNVKVRIAPWVLPSHLNVTEELYVVERSGFNDAFVTDIEAIATAAGVPLVKANITPLDPWIQDSMEVGYSHIPIKQFAVALNAVNSRPLFNFAPDELLGPDYGLHQPPLNAVTSTFDSHGNIEVSPPVTVSGQTFKFGRIYFGGVARSATETFNSDVEAFLRDQLVQKPFSIDTTWLGVGHVDEIMSFIPANVGREFRMLFASVNEALRILRDLQSAGHGSLTLFTGKHPPSRAAHFGDRTINSIMSDTTLMTTNTGVQTRLNGIKARLVTELGLDAANDIIEIPSLFIAESLLPSPIVSALIPGMVNLLVITRPVFTNTQLVFPKPFGPVLGGVDQLEKEVRDKITPLGYGPGQFHFVDDFDTYHINLGEVHCATNSKRRPHITPWFEQEDF